jgi:hypothetical protein
MEPDNSDFILGCGCVTVTLLAGILAAIIVLLVVAL